MESIVSRGAICHREVSNVTSLPPYAAAVCSVACGWTSMSMARGQLLYFATAPHFYHPVKLCTLGSSYTLLSIVRSTCSHHTLQINSSRVTIFKQRPSWLRIIRLDFISCASLLVEVPVISPVYISHYFNVEDSALKQATKGARKLNTTLNFLLYFHVWGQFYCLFIKISDETISVMLSAFGS